MSLRAVVQLTVSRLTYKRIFRFYPSLLCSVTHTSFYKKDERVDVSAACPLV